MPAVLLVCRSHVRSPSRSSPTELHMPLQADVAPAQVSGLKRGASLSLDCEPEQPPPPPKKHGSMHTLRVPTDPRGPTTVAALFAWSIQFWCALRDEGLASLGIDFAACLGSVLAGGLHVHTDYSGMGGPEEAMHEILGLLRWWRSRFRFPAWWRGSGFFALETLARCAGGCFFSVVGLVHPDASSET